MLFTQHTLYTCGAEHFKKEKNPCRKTKNKDTPGFEPGTSRSTVECSTTELYRHV